MYMVQFIGYGDVESNHGTYLENTAAMALRLKPCFRRSVMDCIVWVRQAAAEHHNDSIQPPDPNRTAHAAWQLPCEPKDIVFDPVVHDRVVMVKLVPGYILGWMMIRQVQLEIVS